MQISHLVSTGARHRRRIATTGQRHQRLTSVVIKKAADRAWPVVGADPREGGSADVNGGRGHIRVGPDVSGVTEPRLKHNRGTPAAAALKIDLSRADREQASDLRCSG